MPAQSAGHACADLKAKLPIYGPAWLTTRLVPSWGQRHGPRFSRWMWCLLRGAGQDDDDGTEAVAEGSVA